MQFKRLAGGYRVSAYAGYDKDKRRSIVKIVGWLDHNFQPKDGALWLAALPEDQQKEVKDWIEKTKADDKASMLNLAARYLPSDLTKTVDAIEQGAFEVTEEWAIEAYARIDALTKMLRKKGFKRPAKEKNTAPKALEGQQKIDV